MVRAAAAALAASLLLVTCSARADTEPPPEAPENSDYVLEPEDSTGAGDVGLGFALSGRAGARPQVARRVRFDDGELSAGMRDGAGDPLAGAAARWRLGWGDLALGRIAPQWGLGLVLGSAGEPWSRAPVDRGPESAWRGRSGEGARLAFGGRTLGGDVFAAHFGRRSLAGAGVRAGPMALGAVAAVGAVQVSVSAASGSDAAELAMDGQGRWRAAVARRATLGAWIADLRARGGAVAFRSLAEPRRSGPAQGGSLTLGGGRGLRAHLLAAWWRFQPGVTGARAALELSRSMAHHGSLALGLEEEHGARRDPPPRLTGLRQGAWGEWRGGDPAVVLTLRHELWGVHPFARAAVRELSLARIEARPAGGVTVTLEHAVWRVRKAEAIYLAEAGEDRVTLRALAGSGSRSRLALGVPGARGRLRASAGWAGSGAPQWRIDWTRTARMAGSHDAARGRAP